MAFPEALERAYSLLVAGDLDAADEILLGQDRHGPWFGHTCVLLAKSAETRGQIPFRVDHFLSDFVRGAPTSPAETSAFRSLERLYRQQGLIDLANDLARLTGALATIPQARTPLGALPSLPSLPPLPVAPAAAASEPSPTTPVLNPATTHDAVAAAETDAVFTLTPARVDKQTPGQTQEPARAAAKTPAASASSDEQERPLRPAAGFHAAIGVTVATRYRLLQKLGQGGMASVFRAIDLELDEEVAVKIFDAAHLGPEQLDRFKSELRVARKLRHPNIVQLFDLGVDQGQYFITMELLRGHDLHHVLRAAKGPLPVALAAQYLIDSARGLDAAHQQGIVHRDIKPANLFLHEDERVKVMDFGIAKASLDDGGVQTQTGMLLGTPQYMAPEQAQDSAHVDARCDLYALGIVAFELLTASRPFEGGGVVSVLMAQVNQAPPSPRERNAAIPAALEKLVLRCLAKKPADRPASAAQIADALLPFAKVRQG